MEEKQEKNTGYTGEYGNPVESAREAEDTAYQSGREEQHRAEGQSTADVSQQGAQNRQDGNQTYPGMQHQQNVNQAYAGTQNPQNGYYQNAGYGQGGPGSPVRQPQKPKKDKKQSSGSPVWKKLLVSAACAVVFGLVAGVCFQGVRYVGDRFLSTGSSQDKLKTTTQEANVANSQSTAGPDSANAGSTVPVTGVGTTDVSGIAEQTMPAIVAITSTTQGANYYDLFGREYAGKETTGAGSGFIVAQNDNELLIATNNHVIENAKTISVQFIDEEIYEATVKGTDSANDLAVIAVAVKDIKKETMDKIAVADLGSSEDLKVGEMVIAIGNALGYGQSVTVGYVSAKDREISASDEGGSYGDNSASSANVIKAIQTDAAINPGNSGGALINMRGEVVGINSAKIAASTVEGIGYAIPITAANPIIEDLMNKENLKDEEKGYLGISGQTVTDAATAFNIPNGVQVVEVAKGGAADKAGIQVGDIITSINNMEVRSIESLQEKANSYRKGTEVEIKIQRSDNGVYKEQTVKVKLQGADSLDKLENSGDASQKDQQDPDGNGSGEDPYGNGAPDNGDAYGNDGSDNGDGYTEDDDGYGYGFGDFFDFFN